MAETEHQWDFTDKKQTVIKCLLHDNERVLIKPKEKMETIRALIDAGEWVGPPLDEEKPPVKTEPQPTKQATGEEPTTLPATQQPRADVVSYETFAGQQVELSVKMLQQMLCPQANQQQAQYIVGWCVHNRIDPFSNEAYFSIMDGKPVIQVSKDTWRRRMEGNSRFVKQQSGIRVDTTMEVLKESLLADEDFPYCISPLLKERLEQDIKDGRKSAPEGMPARLTVRKKGIERDHRENLIGGWARIWTKDRPEPEAFDPDLDGWKMTTREGKDNIFWQRKPEFMIWKTALKNCARAAFPELSGLVQQPELPSDDEIEMISEQPGEWQVNGRIQDNREVHRLASLIPEPIGPLTHDDLHDLSVILYAVESMRELSGQQMRNLRDTLQAAVDGDEGILQAIAEDLGKLPRDREEAVHEQTESPDGDATGAESIDAEELAEPEWLWRAWMGGC